MTARAADQRAVYRCPRGHEQWHSGTCTAPGCRRITDLHRWVAVEPLTPAPPLDELLEAGRQLATVAEELRSYSPRAVDLALNRWMLAVRGAQGLRVAPAPPALVLPLLAEGLRQRAAAGGTMPPPDELAYDIACALGVDPVDLDEDPDGLGWACEHLAVALVGRRDDEDGR